MHFDQCFLGACAVDPTHGLTVFDYEDAEFKRALVRQSNELIVVLTSDKIPTIARYKVMPCQEISTLVARTRHPARQSGCAYRARRGCAFFG